jgi:ADP-ribose pyrophosphatase YjhB (NUDIX family)
VNDVRRGSPRYGRCWLLNWDRPACRRRRTGSTVATALAPLHIDADSTETNQWGHTYQFHITVFLATAWTGELVMQTDETTDAGWFHADQLPTPRTAIVERSLQLLWRYDRTGEFLAQ